MKEVEVKFKKALNYAMAHLKDSEYASHILALICYGSCARGTFTEGSDIDLLLILSTETPNKESVVTLKSLVNTGDITLPEVDLKICFGSEVPDNLFYNQVQKEGVVLWKK